MGQDSGSTDAGGLAPHARVTRYVDALQADISRLCDKPSPISRPKIGVMDTGIDLDNPLIPSYVSKYILKCRNFSSDDPDDTHDDDGHGTRGVYHIYGINPCADFYVAKVYKSKTFGHNH